MVVEAACLPISFAVSSADQVTPIDRVTHADRDALKGNENVAPEHDATSPNAEGSQVFPPGIESAAYPAGDMTFRDFGQRGVDGVTKIEAADAYGDMTDGKHGTFLKFSPGFVSPVHSHTADYAAVVIEGQMANYQPGQTPIPMGPGSFWYQKGKQAHTTACLSETGCLAFIIQGHGFDAQIPPVTE